MEIVPVIFCVAAIYAICGGILWAITLPVKGQDINDDLLFYVFAWPIELYRMYKYSQDGDY